MRPQTPVHQLPISWGAESAQLIEAWLGAKVETAFNPWRVGLHPTPPHLTSPLLAPRGAQGSVGKGAGSQIPWALQACEGDAARSAGLDAPRAALQ